MVFPRFTGTLIDGIFPFITYTVISKYNDDEKQQREKEEACEQARLEARYRKEISKDKN